MTGIKDPPDGFVSFWTGAVISRISSMLSLEEERLTLSLTPFFFDCERKVWTLLPLIATALFAERFSSALGRLCAFLEWTMRIVTPSSEVV